MAKYLIHACNQRYWYVNRYLVPSMIEQGIKSEDINVYLDKTHEGCLKAFIESGVKYCNGDGTWHLQDDVVICKDFKERTEKFDAGVVCAFSSAYDEQQEPGLSTPRIGMWWSFPCIRIPDDIMQEFIAWMHAWVWKDPQYGLYVKAKKYDDLFFKIFMENYYPNDKILKLASNLVDHIDYLLGGSVVNKARQIKNVRSVYWEDEDVVENLTNILRGNKVN